MQPYTCTVKMKYHSLPVLAYQFDRNIQGRLTYNLARPSSIVTNIVYSSEVSNMSSSVQVCTLLVARYLGFCCSLYFLYSGYLLCYGFKDKCLHFFFLDKCLHFFLLWVNESLRMNRIGNNIMASHPLWTCYRKGLGIS